MKRFAIFLGGLLMLPAFAEVAPTFYDETLEYAGAEYGDEEYGVAEEEAQSEIINVKAPVKVARQPAAVRTVSSRTTPTRTVPTAATNSSGRGTSAASSRVVASRATTATTPRTTTTSSRAVTTRGSATSAAATRATGGATRATSSARTTSAAATRATGGATRAAMTKTARTTTARTATAGTSGARVSRAATTSAVLGVNGLVNSNVLTTTGESLYKPFNANAVQSARASVRNNDRVVAGVKRAPTIRAASTGITTVTESVSVGAEDLEEMQDLTEITDYCKAQYAACMDNYCNVLDDNQGRCSCSANIANYAKAEEALKKATEELQDVAQKIQYIGLSAREVETLFTQTEAELTMQSKTDTSQLKTSLDKIRDMIIDVQSGTSTSSSSTGLDFDLTGLLDFTIDSTGFDLSSLFGTNVNSVSNQRGAELFKTATNRCKTNVLKACKAQGVDETLITNAYDLEIDRECVAYERSLTDSNEQMSATVRNAKNVLQRARLLVERSKNEYDMRQCINELDKCMQDEYVCGSEYEKCLDPTGRYIVDGEIVVGSQPGHAIDVTTSDVVSSVMTSDVCKTNLYRTWDWPDKSCGPVAVYGGSTSGGAWYGGPASDQNNAWGQGPNDNLANYIKDTVSLTAAQSSSTNMSQFLQNKIGYATRDRNYGMCVSVLNKCQDFTYNGRGTSATYNAQNEVIKQYLQRAMVQIKAKQDTILAEYAESCITDVKTCVAKNGYPDDEPIVYNDETDPTHSNGTNNWTNAQRTQANIAVNACRPTIVTCMSVNGYSIDNPTPTEMNCWVMGLQYDTITQECISAGYAPGDDPTPPTPSSYTVIFDCNSSFADFNTWSVRNISQGQVINMPNSSEVESRCTLHSAYSAYRFGGWVCDGEDISGNTMTVNSNRSCVAVWVSGDAHEDAVWVTYRIDDNTVGYENYELEVESEPRLFYYQANRNIDDVCPVGFYKAKDCTDAQVFVRLGDNPALSQHKYSGHFTERTGGVQVLGNDGKIVASYNPSSSYSDGTVVNIYAHWEFLGRAYETAPAFTLDDDIEP